MNSHPEHLGDKQIFAMRIDTKWRFEKTRIQHFTGDMSASLHDIRISRVTTESSMVLDRIDTFIEINETSI